MDKPSFRSLAEKLLLVEYFEGGQSEDPTLRGIEERVIPALLKKFPNYSVSTIGGGPTYTFKTSKPQKTGTKASTGYRDDDVGEEPGPARSGREVPPPSAKDIKAVLSRVASDMLVLERDDIEMLGKQIAHWIAYKSVYGRSPGQASHIQNPGKAPSATDKDKFERTYRKLEPVAIELMPEHDLMAIMRKPLGDHRFAAIGVDENAGRGEPATRIEFWMWDPSKRLPDVPKQKGWLGGLFENKPPGRWGSEEDDEDRFVWVVQGRRDDQQVEGRR